MLPFDIPRGHRKLSRYLGPDETRWDRRFRRYLHDDPAEHGTVRLRLHPTVLSDPTVLSAKDLSYHASWPAQQCRPGRGRPDTSWSRRLPWLATLPVCG
ncbi:MAG TPA: hypothetical protein VGJ13_10605 [Pseudonocardiaceae bacterium]